jgi:hypothetical protein
MAWREGSCIHAGSVKASFARAVQSRNWTMPSRMFKLRVSADHSPQPHHPSCKPEESVARQPAKRVRGVSVSSCCERARTSHLQVASLRLLQVSGRSTHTRNGGRGTGFSLVPHRTRISRLQWACRRGKSATDRQPCGHMSSERLTQRHGGRDRQPCGHMSSERLTQRHGGRDRQPCGHMSSERLTQRHGGRDRQPCGHMSSERLTRRHGGRDRQPCGHMSSERLTRRHGGRDTG